MTTDPLLSRVLVAAGLDDSGSFTATPGWVNRVWVGDTLVVRLSDGRLRDSFLHEAQVVGLLTDTEVPYARCIGTGSSPDGTWYICERLPGRTLHRVWKELTPTDRREVITALGAAIRALHQVEVPTDLRPPWVWQGDQAALVPGADLGLIQSAQSWMSERLDLFAGDERVLVHGDLHPSNILVDGTKITGLIDFECARAQPADVELYRLLRWCARPQDVPPVPDQPGLDAQTLLDVPSWLRDSYPQPFAVPDLRERLHVYEMQWELAGLHHHRTLDGMTAAQDRIRTVLSGQGPTDQLHW